LVFEVIIGYKEDHCLMRTDIIYFGRAPTLSVELTTSRARTLYVVAP